ncbi:phosphotransferase [soil metagenome]
MLRTEAEILAHLSRRVPDARPAGEPQRLTGGHLNDVWRIPAQPRSLIVKSAPPYVAALRSVPLDPDRIRFEAQSLELLGPEGLLASLCSEALRPPIAIDFDPDVHVLVMEDFGALADLGAHLRRGNGSSDWGDRLGRFVGALHAATAGDETLANLFNNSSVQQSRLTVQYRAVRRLLAESGFAAPPEVARRAAELGMRLTAPGACLTMGDLWPASILVDRDRLRLIDWEFAHYGQPAQDVAHLLGHLWMHAQQARDATGVAERLAQAFLTAYLAAVASVRPTLLDARFVPDCAVHMGAEILMRVIGPFKPGYLYEHLHTDSRPVRDAVGFSIESMRAGSNAWLRPALQI